jgi:hypothetical protein
MFTSHDWVVKSMQNQPTEASVRESLRYQHENPHQAWLARVFDVAGIDYGRIDYGIAGGVPQVWEINLNPTVGRAQGQSRHTGLEPALKALRDEGRELFHVRLRSAFEQLDPHRSDVGVTVPIEASLRARLRQDSQRYRRRERFDGWLATLFDTPLVNQPVKALLSLLPRP